MIVVRWRDKVGDGRLSSERWCKDIVDGKDGAEVRHWSSSRSSSGGVQCVNESCEFERLVIVVICESSSCPSNHFCQTLLQLKRITVKVLSGMVCHQSKVSTGAKTRWQAAICVSRLEDQTWRVVKLYDVKIDDVSNLASA